MKFGRSQHVQASPVTVEVQLRPKRVLSVLIVVAGAFSVVGLVSHVVAQAYPTGPVKGAASLFYLHDELTIPSWYASLQLVLASGLLFWIGACTGRRLRRRWWTLGVLCSFVGMDESVARHEGAGEAIRRWLGGGLGAEVIWWLVAASVVTVVVLVALPLWRSVESPIRRLWVLAAATFLGGALLVDDIEGALRPAEQPEDLVSFVLLAIEEGMELTGVAILVYALMLLLVGQGLRFRVPAALDTTGRAVSDEVSGEHDQAQPPDAESRMDASVGSTD